MSGSMLLILTAALTPLPTAAEVERALSLPRLQHCDELACYYDTRRYRVPSATCRHVATDLATCDYVRIDEQVPVRFGPARRSRAGPAPHLATYRVTLRYREANGARWWSLADD